MRCAKSWPESLRPRHRIANRFTLTTGIAPAYAECLRRAEQLLSEGSRVIVDATFREQHQRQSFLEAAVRFGVPGLMLVCELKPELARQRLETRQGDVSDANWPVYQRLATAWDRLDVQTQRLAHTVSTQASPAEAVQRALTILRRADLWSDLRATATDEPSA